MQLKMKDFLKYETWTIFKNQRSLRNQSATMQDVSESWFSNAPQYNFLGAKTETFEAKDQLQITYATALDVAGCTWLCWFLGRGLTEAEAILSYTGKNSLLA